MGNHAVAHDEKTIRAVSDISIRHFTALSVKVVAKRNQLRFSNPCEAHSPAVDHARLKVPSLLNESSRQHSVADAGAERAQRRGARRR